MTDTTVVDPAAAQVDPAAPAPALEPPAPEPTQQPEPNPRIADSLINTISGLRAARRNLEEENARLRRDADAARALAESYARRGQTSDGTAAAPVMPPTMTQPSPPTDDAEIDRRAEYKLFIRDVQGMQAEGLREFGTVFNEDVRALEALGATDDAFVSQVLAVDKNNAHKIFHSLVQDTNKVLALVNLSPAARIAEITRMSIAMNAHAAKPDAITPATPAAPAKPAAPARKTSAAPAPAPALEPSTSEPVSMWSDKISDQEFSRRFDVHMRERHARR